MKMKGKYIRSKRRNLQPCEAQTEGGAYSCPERGSAVSRETDGKPKEAACPGCLLCMASSRNEELAGGPKWPDREGLRLGPPILEGLGLAVRRAAVGACGAARLS